MTIYHVHFTCAHDYLARRLPFRPAHLKQLGTLRDEARVVAGGPEPDGIAANIFYRVADHAELLRLLEDNEFNRAGLFTAQHPRAFVDFLDPLDRPPLDAGLEATIVEGTPSDRVRARVALAALRRILRGRRRACRRSLGGPRRGRRVDGRRRRLGARPPPAARLEPDPVAGPGDGAPSDSGETRDWPVTSASGAPMRRSCCSACR